MARASKAAKQAADARKQVGVAARSLTKAGKKVVETA